MNARSEVSLRSMEVRRILVRKARLTSKGQVTIPVDVRRALGLEDGDQVVFEVTEEGAYLRRAPTAADLMGSVPALGMDWKTAREIAWKKVGERFRGSSATRTSSSDS